jgi:hypothetical protein
VLQANLFPVSMVVKNFHVRKNLLIHLNYNVGCVIEFEGSFDLQAIPSEKRIVIPENRRP